MVTYLSGSVFLWAAICLAALAFIFAVKTYLGYTKLEREARADWDYRAANNMEDLRLTRSGYVSAYKRVNAPRATLYALMTMLAILFLTPVILGLLDRLMLFVYQATGQSRTFEPGYLVWQFYLFFGVLAAWAGIGAFAARQYHKRAPRSMREELQTLREAYVPPAKFTVRPSPAHLEIYESETALADTLFADILQLSPAKEAGYPHAVQTYQFGGQGVIAHILPEDGDFDEQTQNLLQLQKHKREAPEAVRYELIFKLKEPVQIINRLRSEGIKITNVGKYPHEYMRSFSFRNLDFYIYKDGD